MYEPSGSGKHWFLVLSSLLTHNFSSFMFCAINLASGVLLEIYTKESAKQIQREFSFIFLPVSSRNPLAENGAQKWGE